MYEICMSLNFEEFLLRKERGIGNRRKMRSLVGFVKMGDMLRCSPDDRMMKGNVLIEAKVCSTIRAKQLKCKGEGKTHI